MYVSFMFSFLPLSSVSDIDDGKFIRISVSIWLLLSCLKILALLLGLFEKIFEQQCQQIHFSFSIAVSDFPLASHYLGKIGVNGNHPSK